MPLRRPLPLLALALAALLLGGCGGGDDEGPRAATQPTTAVAPAAGTPIGGTGYRLRAAAGWIDVKAQVSGSADVILATQSGSVMNVLREKLAPGIERNAALEELARRVLQGAGARRRSASAPTTLDGADGITFRVRIEADGRPADGRVVIVVHDGYAYAIAGTTSPDEPVSADRALQSMLSSWRWT